MTTITSGIVTTIEAARIVPQGCSCSLAPLNWEITTGTVFMLSLTVNVRANKNSFQAPMKARSPVEIRPGIANGNKIRQKTVSGEAPST
jgi:hypothetical protein